MCDIKLSQLAPVLKEAEENDAMTRELDCFHDPDFIDATVDLYHRFSQNVKIVRHEYLGKILDQPGTTIFEGAQGVLLDEWYGFYPYNTWSTLTFKNADLLLDENQYPGEVLKFGLIRAYATRHGAGPFVTEDRELSIQVPDHHNENNPWQRQFRVGYLDLVALRYAIQVTGWIDGLVVTNLDRMEGFSNWKICNQYESSSGLLNLEKHFTCKGTRIHEIRVPDDPTDLVQQEELTKLLLSLKPVYELHPRNMVSYVDRISQELGIPLAITSFGPTAEDKILHSLRHVAERELLPVK